MFLFQPTIFTTPMWAALWLRIHLHVLLMQKIRIFLGFFSILSYQFILTLISHVLYPDLHWYWTWLEDQHQWWRQLKIYYIKSSQILSRLHVLHVTLRLGQNSSAVKINYYKKKNIIMGLSRLLKNEWVIYVKSFVLHGHNDAHATNSLFTSNLYIFPYKLVGKLCSHWKL